MQLDNEAYILLQWKRSYTDYLFITKPLSPMQFPTVVKQQRQQQDDNMYERKKDEKNKQTNKDACAIRDNGKGGAKLKQYFISILLVERKPIGFP